MFDKKVIYFFTVVEEGSFSKAAEKLYLSQSAVSQHIKLLETELKVSLFDRSHYRPKLTEAGKFYYQNCFQLYKQYQKIEEELKKEYRQIIRIGFTGLYENKDILSLVNNFKKKHPLLEVSFVVGSFEECVENLLDNKTDVSFGLSSDFKARKELAYQELYRYDLCIITSLDHPLAKYEALDVKEIENEQFIILSQKYGRGFYHDFMNAFKLDKIKPQIKKAVDSFDELVFNVSIGEGIAIVSDDVVSDSEVKKIKLLNSHHQSSYAIGYNKELDSELIKMFIADSIDHFKLYKKNL